MSSPPSNKSCNRAGLFKRPVHSSASPRWPQALVQNRKQLRLRSFVLAAWPSCRGPRQPAANELGGGPVRHVLSPSATWPACLCHARPRHIPCPNSLLHFTACRAMLFYAPISLDLTRSRQVAPPSRSKPALNSRSVSGVERSGRIARFSQGKWWLESSQENRTRCPFSS